MECESIQFHIQCCEAPCVTLYMVFNRERKRARSGQSCKAIIDASIEVDVGVREGQKIIIKTAVKAVTPFAIPQNASGTPSQLR